MGIVRTFGRALVAWWNDDGFRLGASVSFYTLFALAPMLLVATAVAGTMFGAEAVRGEIAGQVKGLVGNEGGDAVQALLRGAASRGDSMVAATIGSVAFVLAACGAFLELQAAFNTIWRVVPAPQGRLRYFLVDRLRSFGLVVAIGFLLMVSLAVSAALAALDVRMARWAPGAPMVVLSLSVVVSLAVTGVLFALLFKILPDVNLRWADVGTGATVTALLFGLGQRLIGLYLGKSGIASAYGAVGSVMVLMLWVYYSSQIVLIGAEFTKLHAERVHGFVDASAFAKKADGADEPISL